MAPPIVPPTEYDCPSVGAVKLFVVLVVIITSLPALFFVQLRFICDVPAAEALKACGSAMAGVVTSVVVPDE